MHLQLQQAVLVLVVLIVGFVHSYLTLNRRDNANNRQCRNKEGGHTWDHSILNLSYHFQPFPDNLSVFAHNQDTNCPSFSQLISESNQPSAQNLSLCPWTTETSHDPDRFPHNMTYARCSCKKCITWNQSGDHYCVAHYHNFKVIRRECDGRGVYRYYYTMEHLPIACVCAHEYMVVVSSSSGK